MKKCAHAYRLRCFSAALASLFVLGQLIAPLHGWLETGTRPVHHDGFQWSAAGDIAAGLDVHAEDHAAHDDAVCHDGEDTHEDGSCHDGGDCHDDGCGSCCHHLPIQSALQRQAPDRDVTVLRAAAPAVSDILPGTLPEPFLPPRSLS